MARRFAKYWEKLKDQKYIEIKLSTDNVDENLTEKTESIAKSLRNSLSRCKNEDQFYRRECPHAKLRTSIKSPTIILIELDEEVRITQNSSIRLEDL